MSFASSVRNQGSNRNSRPQESVQVSVWRSGWWVKGLRVQLKPYRLRQFLCAFSAWGKIVIHIPIRDTGPVYERPVPCPFSTGKHAAASDLRQEWRGFSRTCARPTDNDPKLGRLFFQEVAWLILYCARSASRRTTRPPPPPASERRGRGAAEGAGKRGRALPLS